MKKFIILGVIAVILFMGYSVAVTESYFQPYPYIDTKLSDNFSWKNYENINKGMATAEVKNLLGNPIDSFGAMGGYYKMKEGEWDSINFVGSTYTEQSKSECWQYSTDGGKYAYWDFAWISVNVCFDENGIVKNKNQTIFYN